MDFMHSLSDYLLTPILDPLLQIPPVVTLVIVGLFISLVSVLFQKHFTDQAKLKRIKAETKKLQQELKKHRDSPEKQLKINKKIMPMQGELMKETLKPTFYTIVPFLLLFMWLSGHFAYAPLEPGMPFTITASVEDGVEEVLLEQLDGLTFLSTPKQIPIDNKASWELTGEAGFYPLTFSTANTLETKDILITKAKKYEMPLEVYSGEIKKIEVSNAPLKPLGDFAIFGWLPGWIWVYIFFSIVFSVILRKVLDVA